MWEVTVVTKVFRYLQKYFINCVGYIYSDAGTDYE